MRYLVLVSFIVSILFARDNPFIAAKNGMEEDKIEATNIKPSYDEFSKKEIQLPNYARVLRYVVVGYQVLDGSIKELKVPIDATIDWHDPLILSINDDTPNAPDITLEKDNLPPLEPKIEQKVVKTVPIKKQPQVVKQAPKSKPKEDKKQTQTFHSFFKFTTQGRFLTIYTKDTMIRDLIVSKPYKIVLDFKSDTTFYTKTLKIDNPPFKKVTFGSHDGYYRASFLLDGPYPYNIIKQGEETVIELH